MPFEIRQFPHCDQSVLHSPAQNCQYCNEKPEWQALREAWGINFTGETDPNKTPCPATVRRSVETIHRWRGNAPKPDERGVPKTAFERLIAEEPRHPQDDPEPQDL